MSNYSTKSIKQGLQVPVFAPAASVDYSLVWMDCLIHRRLFNHNRTGLIPRGNARFFFHIEYFPATDPIQRFLQQSHRQVTDWVMRFAFPAQRTALDVPE